MVGNDSRKVFMTRFNNYYRVDFYISQKKKNDSHNSHEKKNRKNKLISVLL